MSRQTAYTQTAILLPTGFTTAGSYTFTITDASNAYTDSNSTTMATLQLASSSRNTRKSEGYYEFDKSPLSQIPSDATINSVTCYVKYNISSTNYVSALSMQLYRNTTAMGTAITSRPTSATRSSITPGTWTLAQLNDIRLYVTATHTASSTAAYLYFYGADVTISYTISGIEYEVNITNSTTATTEPPTGKTYVFQGEDQEIKLNTTNITNLNVTDNGNAVSLSPVYAPIESASTFIPNNYSAQSTTYTISGDNGYNSTANTSSYARLRSSTNTQYYTYYFFDTNIIPSTSEIVSISCQIRGRAENGTSGTYVGYAQLMGVTDLKGAEVVISSQTTGGIVISLTSGANWTTEDARNIKLCLRHPYGGSNRYVSFYGASLTINYMVPGTGGTVMYYTYTISNIAADHTIVISDKEKVKVNVNGTWVDAVSVHKRINGEWQLQSDLTNLFDNNTIYVKGN